VLQWLWHLRFSTIPPLLRALESEPQMLATAQLMQPQRHAELGREVLNAKPSREGKANEKHEKHKKHWTRMKHRHPQ